ncbi:MAG: BBP7 family outer membrane beta-barrel protein [Planctomycetota bacterium]|nr:BBP7 family outer membrane beta-barrel protein [Planctomycetota bacterium]
MMALVVGLLLLPAVAESAARGPRASGTREADASAMPASLEVEEACDSFGCTSCVGPGDVTCADNCDPCCRFTSVWGNIEYLLLWDRGQDLPPLVTTNDDLNTLRENAGVLGNANTRTLFGDEGMDDNRHAGRVTFGMWWDQAATVGIGFGYLGVGKSTVNLDANSSEFPILARPFFNAIDSSEDALLLGFPNAFSGDVSIRSTSELNAAEVFKRQCCFRGCNYRVDILVGYRYAQLQDSLRIEDSFEFLVQQNVPGGTPIPAGSTVQNFDQFDVDNTYHAGQLGAWAQKRNGNFSLDLIGKVAFGQMNFDVSTQGQTTSTQPNVAAVTVPGGLLVQQSNLGNFKDHAFAVMPEASANLGYQLSPFIDLTVGYTFLYWNRVVRPGDVVDRVVDLRQQGGNLPDVQARPEIAFRDTGYWLQGMTFGVNFRF